MGPIDQSREPLQSIWLSFPARFYFQLCASVGDEGSGTLQTHRASRNRQRGTGTTSQFRWRTFCYASFGRLCTSRWHLYLRHSLESWTWVSQGDTVSDSGSSSWCPPMTQHGHALCSLSLKEDERFLSGRACAPPLLVMPHEVRSSYDLRQACRSSYLSILARELI